MDQLKRQEVGILDKMRINMKRSQQFLSNSGGAEEINSSRGGQISL